MYLSEVNKNPLTEALIHFIYAFVMLFFFYFVYFLCFYCYGNNCIYFSFSLFW